MTFAHTYLLKISINNLRQINTSQPVEGHHYFISNRMNKVIILRLQLVKIAEPVRPGK